MLTLHQAIHFMVHSPLTCAQHPEIFDCSNNSSHLKSSNQQLSNTEPWSQAWGFPPTCFTLDYSPSTFCCILSIFLPIPCPTFNNPLPVSLSLSWPVSQSSPHFFRFQVRGSTNTCSYFAIGCATDIAPGLCWYPTCSYPGSPPGYHLQCLSYLSHMSLCCSSHLCLSALYLPDSITSPAVSQWSHQVLLFRQPIVLLSHLRCPAAQFWSWSRDPQHHPWDICLWFIVCSNLQWMSFDVAKVSKSDLLLSHH